MLAAGCTRLDAASRLCQPPVDHKSLAERAHNDVRRFDVPVQHAAAMGVIDCVAHVQEAAEELAELERAFARVGFEVGIAVKGGDRRLEAVATDEPHCIKGAPVGVGAQAIDRDDSRVLEAAGDLGFEQEACAAGWVESVVVEDFLECDFAVELAVDGDEDGAEPTFGVGSQDAITATIGDRCAGGKIAWMPGPAVAVDDRAVKRSPSVWAGPCWRSSPDVKAACTIAM